MQEELTKISKHHQGTFGLYQVVGAKYSGGDIVGWLISLQIGPHEPSREYWVCGREIREATVSAMPDAVKPGEIVTGTELEQEAIFAAIGEWEKGTTSQR